MQKLKPIVFEDLCKYKFLSGIEYSPNQTCAAFVVSSANLKANGYDSNIYIYENGKTRQLTAMNKERSFFFEDDENILFAAARTAEEQEQAKSGADISTNYYRINIHGGESVKAFTLPYGGGITERIDSKRLLVSGGIDPKYPDYYKMSAKERAKVDAEKKELADYEIIDEWPFWMNGGGMVNKSRQALFIYDTVKNSSTRITGPYTFVWDSFVRDGAVYYLAIDYQVVQPLTPDVFRYDVKTGETVKVFDGSKFYAQGILNLDGKTLVVGSDCKHHGINEDCKLYVLDENKGKLKLLFAPESSLYGSVGSDCKYGGGKQQRTTDRLYTVSTVRNAAHLYEISAKGVISPVYTEEGEVSCFDVKKDNSEILFIGFRGQQLQELYSLKCGKVKQLTHFNDAMLKGRYVAKPEKMTIQSQGWDIDGWVLKPIDYDENKKYPAVFEVHGGPKTVYGEVFEHEMQCFASKGYFVFFCNPMGGDGRGDEFADIRGHYGDTDFKNLMDFCDAVLKKYPQIDPKRVGETGGSYGGFMTNWIVGHTNRFACAATQRSISNWISFAGISDIGPYFATDQTDGDIWKDFDKMWDQSPLKYADKVKTPLLFIHSDEDYRCPLSQGLQFYTALTLRGVDTRMCMFHGENHELSRSGKPKHRLKRLQEIAAWMDKYCKED